MIVCWIITSEEIFLNPFRLILSKSHKSLKSQGSDAQSLKSSLYEPKEDKNSCLILNMSLLQNLKFRGSLVVISKSLKSQEPRIKYQNPVKQICMDHMKAKE